MSICLLDYGAGNVRSVRNAIRSLGFEVKDITSAQDIAQAERIIFPGVGSFGSAVQRLKDMGVWQALYDYVQAGKPFLGVCLGLQLLFQASEETPNVQGLGIIPGVVGRFQVAQQQLTVPHIGWNGINVVKPSPICHADDIVYFVHSFRAMPSPDNHSWISAVTDYGEKFISVVQKGAVFAAQFHPEKSGTTGLAFLHKFLHLPLHASPEADQALSFDDFLVASQLHTTALRKRVIACLDVRANDNGDIVVTKGDQYDVREKSAQSEVRNLGKPVDLAARYYEDGADEITFLNITGFRESPVGDSPMRKVLELASERVFVPITIGGGIRDHSDESGNIWSALDVANAYFRAGADKVSIGSDAVFAAEAYYASGKQMTGSTCIEMISHVYGRQAVVISVDPRRVYVSSPEETHHRVVHLTHKLGPNQEKMCWYQCTVKGGREGRDIDAFELAQACEALGAGELLVNCIDMDGSKTGFDVDFLRDLAASVGIPVIASSGAGAVQHFSEVFHQTSCSAALAAGIFHRNEVSLQEVKAHLTEASLSVRLA